MVYTLHEENLDSNSCTKITKALLSAIVSDAHIAGNKPINIRDCAGKLKICVTNTKSLSKPEVALNLKTMATQKNNVSGRKAASIYLIQFLL